MELRYESYSWRVYWTVLGEQAEVRDLHSAAAERRLLDWVEIALTYTSPTPGARRYPQLTITPVEVFDTATRQWIPSCVLTTDELDELGMAERAVIVPGGTPAAVRTVATQLVRHVNTPARPQDTASMALIQAAQTFVEQVLGQVQAHGLPRYLQHVKNTPDEELVALVHRITAAGARYVAQCDRLCRVSAKESPSRRPRSSVSSSTVDSREVRPTHGDAISGP